MAKIRFLAIFGFLTGMLQATPNAIAASSGNYVINVAGFLRLPINKYGTVSCSATAFLVPDTSGGTAVANLSAAILANSGLSSASAPATVSGQHFSCQVIVPFLFNNSGSGQNVTIAYTVKVHDTVMIDLATTPPTPLPTTGNRVTRQLIPNVPASSQTFNVNIYI